MSTLLNQHKQLIADAFSAAASTYDQAAIIEYEIGNRLISKLQDFNLQPQYILDLGSGTGLLSASLQKTFPQAQIIQIDFAFGMLNFAKQNRDAHYCCADAETLPFANKQFDLVFSNCCLHLMHDPSKLVTEVSRLLNTHGLFIFSCFGPNTLQDLGLESNWHDMHQYGDLLLMQNFHNPVLDTEQLTFQYPNLEILLDDLQNSGAFRIDRNLINYPDQMYETAIETIYGFAWAQQYQLQHKDQDGNIYIPIESIKHLT